MTSIRMYQVEILTRQSTRQMLWPDGEANERVERVGKAA